MNKTLTNKRYSKLVADIRKLIEEGRARATRAAHQELVRTYWEVGKRISEEGLSHHAGYNQSILEDMADELDVDYTTLTRCIYFFQTYVLATSSKNITWSHYKYLLSINDDEERAWYEQATDQKDWNVLQLAQAIKEKKYVQSKKSRKKKYRTPKLKRPTETTYIYKAAVERVIDGDTLYLRIDLGFQVLKEQRIRLGAIDCEPVDTPKGKEAAQYVRDQLARVDFVMVKTNKIDIYGRYLGDIFYSTGEKDKNKIFKSGKYLNQELIDKDFATVI